MPKALRHSHFRGDRQQPTHVTELRSADRLITIRSLRVGPRRRRFRRSETCHRHNVRAPGALRFPRALRCPPRGFHCICDGHLSHRAAGVQAWLERPDQRIDGKCPPVRPGGHSGGTGLNPRQGRRARRHRAGRPRRLGRRPGPLGALRAGRAGPPCGVLLRDGRWVCELSRSFCRAQQELTPENSPVPWAGDTSSQ